MSGTADTASRPAYESLLDVASLSSLTFGIGLAGIWLAAGADIGSMWRVSTAAGETVLEQLGWVFGIYVPTLLGFYVLVTGEQLGQGDSTGKLRRLLGGVAELSFAALLPGLLLVVLFCLSEPAKIGALFVVFPATFLLGFLTLELGAFVVFDISVRLADATRAREEAAARLRHLRHRSRRSVVVVMTVTMVALTTLGTVVLVATGHWAWLAQWETYAIIGLWALFASIGGLLVAVARTKPTRFDSIVATLGVVLVWVLLSGVAMSHEAHRLWPIIVSATAVAGTATLSAFWPIRSGPRLVVDWCLAGIGAAIAARGAVRTLRRSADRIAELEQVLARDERPSLRRRWDAARAVLVGRAPTNSQGR